MAFMAAAGVLGALAGSFFTALIPRLGTGETVLTGRSRCDSCAKTLRWFELLPVLSFAIQGGRCRFCRGPIPRSYPAIELSTAFLFAATAWALGRGLIPSPFLGEAAGAFFGSVAASLVISFFSYAFFAATAVAVSFYDLLHRLIPAVLIWPLAAIGLAEKVAGAPIARDAGVFFSGAGMAGAAFLMFWSIWFFSKGRAMGRGDADVAKGIWLFLRPVEALAGLVFAFWLGAAFGIMALFLRKLGWKSQMPFAPFLFAGALAALFASGYVRAITSSLYGI